MPRLADDLRVLVNTGGPDIPGTVVSTNPPIPALKGSVLIAFDNGSRQWIPADNVRPDPFPTQFR